MTSWQDPPLTRREARERERRAAEATGQGSRRAGTTEPTAAGDEPRLSRPEPPEATEATETTDASSARSEAPQPTRPPALPGDTTERTLTRRQLRAMLQAQEAERLAAAGQAPKPTASEPESTEPGTTEPESAEPEPAPAPRFTVVPDVVTDDGTLMEGTVVDETVIEAQLVETGPTETQPPVSQPQDIPLVVPEHPEPAKTPVPMQHGSTDVVDPDPQHNPAQHHPAQHNPGVHDTGGHSRDASALILPVLPAAPDATGPLTRTGEILVTGSIDLPRSLGATGQHPNRFDSADMDRMFDSETDPNTSSVEPIRASRAISTHSSTREMITPARKRGTHLPVILAVTASVLLLGVIALVVAGFVFGVF
jgi:hypothetical protein